MAEKSLCRRKSTAYWSPSRKFNRAYEGKKRGDKGEQGKAK